jgi:hypothetical protein
MLLPVAVFIGPVVLAPDDQLAHPITEGRQGLFGLGVAATLSPVLHEMAAEIPRLGDQLSTELTFRKRSHGGMNPADRANAGDQ